MVEGALTDEAVSEFERQLIAGIGFIVIGEATDYETWDFEVEPNHNDPDPADLDNFIRTQTSEEFKDRILSWCRTL
jgi:hypothetical protein